MQSVPGRSSFIAKMNPTVFGSDPFHNPAHAFLAGVHLAQKAHLCTSPSISNRDGIAYFRDIDPYKNFAIIRHGSSSCDEDRLGQPEQPSDAQCSASHLTPQADIPVSYTHLTL